MHIVPPVPHISSESHSNSNGFQQLLHLERQLKLERQRNYSSTALSPEPTAEKHRRRTSHYNTSSTLPWKSKATPTLLHPVTAPPSESDQIPRIDLTHDMATEQHVFEEWGPSPALDVSWSSSDDTGDTSDQSESICHSPSWEGYHQAKTKKEEAKQAKKRLSREPVIESLSVDDGENSSASKRTDTKPAKKTQPTRLRKLPPSASKTHQLEISRRGISTSTSRGREGIEGSEPTSPSSTTTAHDKRRLSFGFKSKQEVGRSNEVPNSRKRSSSLSSLFRSSSSNREDATPETHRCGSAEPGFIGGIKLRREQRKDEDKFKPEPIVFGRDRRGFDDRGRASISSNNESDHDHRDQNQISPISLCKDNTEGNNPFPAQPSPIKTLDTQPTTPIEESVADQVPRGRSQTRLKISDRHIGLHRRVHSMIPTTTDMSVRTVTPLTLNSATTPPISPRPLLSQLTRTWTDSLEKLQFQAVKYDSTAEGKPPSCQLQTKENPRNRLEPTSSPIYASRNQNQNQDLPHTPTDHNTSLPYKLSKEASSDTVKFPPKVTPTPASASEGITRSKAKRLRRRPNSEAFTQYPLPTTALATSTTDKTDTDLLPSSDATTVPKIDTSIAATTLAVTTAVATSVTTPSLSLETTPLPVEPRGRSRHSRFSFPFARNSTDLESITDSSSLHTLRGIKNVTLAAIHRRSYSRTQTVTPTDDTTTPVNTACPPYLPQNLGVTNTLSNTTRVEAQAALSHGNDGHDNGTTILETGLSDLTMDGDQQQNPMMSVLPDQVSLLSSDDSSSFSVPLATPSNSRPPSRRREPLVYNHGSTRSDRQRNAWLDPYRSEPPTVGNYRNQNDRDQDQRPSTINWNGKPAEAPRLENHPAFATLPSHKLQYLQQQQQQRQMGNRSSGRMAAPLEEHSDSGRATPNTPSSTKSLEKKRTTSRLSQAISEQRSASAFASSDVLPRLPTRASGHKLPEVLRSRMSSSSQLNSSSDPNVSSPTSSPLSSTSPTRSNDGIHVDKRMNQIGNSASDILSIAVGNQANLHSSPHSQETSAHIMSDHTPLIPPHAHQHSIQQHRPSSSLGNLHHKSNSGPGHPSLSRPLTPIRVGSSASVPWQYPSRHPSKRDLPPPPSEPMAKFLVECCRCHFYHDMPSRVYEYMLQTDSRVEDPALGVSGAITVGVKCPWCSHGMTRECCAGYVAVIQLQERLH